MELKLSENASRVLERRYLKKDHQGQIIETPKELFRRVAKAIAEVEKLYSTTDAQVKELEKSFAKMMSSLDFMPNSPTLMNAGRELGQLSACFTLPINDSMESIFQTLKDTGITYWLENIGIVLTLFSHQSLKLILTKNSLNHCTLEIN